MMEDWVSGSKRCEVAVSAKVRGRERSGRWSERIVVGNPGQLIGREQGCGSKMQTNLGHDEMQQIQM
jgi:hypothetical protein